MEKEKIKNSSSMTATKEASGWKWMELQTLTLMTLSSSAWQELWSVTSATFPAWVTMNTFMTCDTCRPVRTAVFISSQFCGWEKCNKLVSIIESSGVESCTRRTFDIGSTDCMSSFWISSFATSFLRCSSCGCRASAEFSLVFGPSCT